MKVFTILAALCTLEVTKCYEIGPVPFSISSQAQSQIISCSKYGWSCKNCDTLEKCDTTENNYQISCSAQFPNKPYCDPKTAECVEDPQVCDEEKTEFICPNTGIYPDITNCRKYISCPGKNQLGISYFCLFSSIFNPVLNICMFKSECYNPISECNGEFKIFPYKLNPTLYVVCRGEEKPLLKDCGHKYLQFDPKTLKCDFNCIEEGNFINPNNNKKYYVCVYNNEAELVRIEQECNSGTIFNEDYGSCIYDEENEETTEESTTDILISTETTLSSDTEDYSVSSTTEYSEIQTNPTSEDPFTTSESLSSITSTSESQNSNSITTEDLSSLITSDSTVSNEITTNEENEKTTTTKEEIDENDDKKSDESQNNSDKKEETDSKEDSNESKDNSNESRSEKDSDSSSKSDDDSKESKEINEEKRKSDNEDKKENKNWFSKLWSNLKKY